MSSWIIILFLVFVFLIISFFKDKKLNSGIKKTNISIDMYMEKLSKDNIVIDLGFDSGIKSLKDVDKKGICVSTVGNHFKKGYDFFIVEQKNNNVMFPKHVHNISSEFFFVISGKIRINTNGTGEETLSEGQCHFVKNKISHSVVALEESKYIVIAKPSLTKRIGNFYERLYKLSDI